MAKNEQDKNKKRLGEILIERGIITEDQLRIALLEQASVKKRIGAILISLGFVTESIIRDALSENTGFASVDLASAVIDAAAITFVPQDLARRFKMLPISYNSSENQLTLAMADTFNIVALDQVRALHGPGDPSGAWYRIRHYPDHR